MLCVMIGNIHNPRIGDFTVARALAENLFSRSLSNREMLEPALVAGHFSHDSLKAFSLRDEDTF